MSCELVKKIKVNKKGEIIVTSATSNLIPLMYDDYIYDVNDIEIIVSNFKDGNYRLNNVSNEVCAIVNAIEDKKEIEIDFFDNLEKRKNYILKKDKNLFTVITNTRYSFKNGLSYSIISVENKERAIIEGKMFTYQEALFIQKQIKKIKGIEFEIIKIKDVL